MTFFRLNFLSKCIYMYCKHTVLSLILLVSEMLKIARSKFEAHFLKKLNFVTNKCLRQDAFGKFPMTTEVRRFYLTGGMMNRYPFIWGLLERSFSELNFCNASLLNQYKFIAFKIFSCKALIISGKTSIITVISNEKPNELAIYVKLCQNVTIFYQQELFLYFRCRKNWERAGIQNKIFWVAILLLMTFI